MSKGFGGLNRAKAKAIIQSLKQSSVFKNEDVAYERRIWDDDYSFRTCDPIGEDELFQPSTYLYRNAEIAARDIQVNLPGLRVYATLQLGFWSLGVTQDTMAKSKFTQEWDFTICVKVGNNLCFHPTEVKNKILCHHSESVYLKWKKTVLDDLPKFAAAIEAFNPPRHIVSTACSRSSERVCRKLNLHVSEGRAFMLHNPNKKCLHKAGTFIS